MSYLQQLRRQAQALQVEHGAAQQGIEENTQATEQACERLHHYFGELARQLNVIQPPATFLGLDKRDHWGDMRQCEFRVDARKKRLRDRETFEYVAMGWQLLPRTGPARKAQVSVNFPPDQARVEKRLGAGQVPHERQEQRHPETNALQAYIYMYERSARASVMVNADHDAAQLKFRLGCVGRMEIVQLAMPASKVDGDTLDELARLIVGEPSHFLSV